MNIHLLKTLETHPHPSDSTISHLTLDGSSPILLLPAPPPPRPPPPLQTLDGSSPSSRTETLDGPLLSSHVETLDGSSHPSCPETLDGPTFSSYLETLDDQQPHSLSTLDSSRVETLDGSKLSSHLEALDDQQPHLSSALDGSLPFHSETLDDNSNSQFLTDIEAPEAEEEDETSPSSPFNLFGNNSSNVLHSPWSSLFLSSEMKPSMVGAGLHNLGNTCFLNAVLQCFTHTVPLIESLRSCSHTTPCARDSDDFCVLCVLRDHIERSLVYSGGIVSPLKLVNNLSYFSSCFRRYQQEDAHEFLQCLLDKLDSCYLDSRTQDTSSSSQDDNFVKRIFGGRLISKLRCCNCGHCSDTYEPLIDLSLEIEEINNLPSALESFTKVEKIEDPEVKFTCGNCKEEVSLEKQFMLDQAPSVAAFHLKRFKNDGSYVEKIDKYVEYPLELDLQPFTRGSQDCNWELKYELYAIVVHIGVSSTSGHYFCFIRSSPDTWYKLDDTKVTMVREDTALSQEAYILFYARQGTPWFLSLMEAQKPCLDPNISNTSPKSVLDIVDDIRTSYPGVVNVGVNETRDAAEGISAQFCSGSRHDGDEVKEAMVQVKEAMVQVKEAIDDTQSTTTIPIGASDCCDETKSSVEKPCTTAAFRENNSNQEVNKVRKNSHINPQTPPRSPSPDIYFKELPEVSYHIPRDHLRSEKQVPCKRPLDKALEDAKRKEALRYVVKYMPVSRSMKIIAALGSRSEGSPNKKNNKRKRGLSPCKTTSPPSARRKHSHRASVHPVVAPILH